MAKEVDTLPTYVGESSRTLYIRANQHIRDCNKVVRLDPSQLKEETTSRKSDLSSWMVDHFRTSHREEAPPEPRKDFKFSILQKNKDPFTRQVEESCRITQSLDNHTLTSLSGTQDPVIPLNRKGEMFAPRSRFNYLI